MEYLNYQEIGDGKPLVILHGLYGYSDNWLRVAKYFASDYRVILVDQRNHGGSFKSETHDYESMVEDLRLLLTDKLSLQEFALMGHSMGGKTAMVFTNLYPQMVSKLVVVDIGPIDYTKRNFHSNFHQGIISALKSLNLNNIETYLDAEKLLLEKGLDKRLIGFLLKNLKKNAGNFYWQLNIDVLEQNLSKIAGGIKIDKSITVPTLFVKGENSDYLLPEDSYEIKNVFKGSVWSVIKNAGHWVHAEQYDIFVKTVDYFLK